MVLILARIFAAGFVIALLFASCGVSDETDSSGMDDTERVINTDTLPALPAISEIEYLRAAHILITWNTAKRDTVYYTEDALETIRNIEDSILSGEAAFEEMAFNYSHCTSAADSGTLPAFTTGGITAELDSAVSALEPGEMSGIIRTRFGYHLVKRMGS
ncbi:MAG: peptidylprolyl isomerase [Candidatus Aegiribacteria sp.]|nr:peptidylprolyl isomerase [Candidatus Aegiribacteria sp.]